MGMRKFGSAAPPFGKVACAVKALVLRLIITTKGVYMDPKKVYISLP